MRPANRTYIYIATALALFLLIGAALLAFVFRTTAPQAVVTPRTALVGTPSPTATVTATASPVRPPLRIATAPPPPTPADVPTAAPPSPTDRDIATAPPTTPSTATPSVPVTANTPTATRSPAVFATLTATSVYPAMVKSAPLPLAQSAAGTWQGSSEGITSYQLPEGAVEGEALGETTSVGPTLQVMVQSEGEDCGIALGNPSDFILLRLRLAGAGAAFVSLDRWQRDNFTTPPPSTILRIPSPPNDGWYQVQLSVGEGNLSYRVGESATSVSLDLPANPNFYLYAGGSGCRYRPAN